MNKILETTKPIIEKAKNVKINLNILEKVCSKLTKENLLQYYRDEAPFEYKKLGAEKELNFIFISNAINFCYWGDPKWTINYQDKKLDGYWAMIASLRRAILQGIPLLNANYLKIIRKNDLSNILQGEHIIPLFEERLNILREIGTILIKKYNGEFINIIKSANKDVLKLLEILTIDFPSYNDFAIYKGQKVFFHKRAQLAISDVYRTFKGKGFGEFNNINELTAFADYKIPQSLRKLGVLEYSTNLAKKIDNKIEIPSGSEEEIEIRASQIWAVEYMKKILKSRIPNILSIDLDSWLWLQGQNKSPDDKPYHRTRTIFY